MALPLLAELPDPPVSDGELVERIIGLGSRAPPGRGDTLLDALGGLTGLSRASPHSLKHFGLTLNQAVRLVATVELGCRLARAAVPRRDPLHPSPELLVRYLALRYGTSNQEILGALYLDRRGFLVGEEEVYRGTLQRCAVEPRRVLRSAFLRKARGIILFHNHPSSDPTPSGEDLIFTRRFAEACDFFGFDFRDHLVVGAGGRFASLLEPRYW